MFGGSVPSKNLLCMTRLNKFGEIEESVACPSCGRSLEQGWVACPACGLKLGVTGSSPRDLGESTTHQTITGFASLASSAYRFVLAHPLFAAYALALGIVTLASIGFEKELKAWRPEMPGVMIFMVVLVLPPVAIAAAFFFAFDNDSDFVDYNAVQLSLFVFVCCFGLSLLAWIKSFTWLIVLPFLSAMLIKPPQR